MKKIIDYRIVELSWCKRREYEKKELNVEAIMLNGFKKERFSLCDMIVILKSGEEIKLSGQVIHNQIKDQWMINGIDSKGNQVAIEVG